jgi:hypothetical protein
MSDRLRFLLSPYRLPTHHTVYLNEDEMSAWLNGYAALWHPALVLGSSKPPGIDSCYDHDPPVAGRVYMVPESPPQFMANDWPDRIALNGALKVTALPDRPATLAGLIAGLHASAATDIGRAHFGSPEQLQLLDLPAEALRPFFGLAFGYLMIDSLFEAMDHEKLLDVPAFWGAIQQAATALLTPETASAAEEHLREAAAKLLQAREVLYSVNIHLLDLWRLSEENLAADFPSAIDKGVPINLFADGRTLELLAERQPEKTARLRDRMKEEIQPPVLEVIGGIQLERADATLSVGSQLWNLRQGRATAKRILGCNVEVLGRIKSANHPHIPAWVQATGFRRAILVAFDAAVVPSYRATVVNWSSPDGKSIDAFTRKPSPANKVETYFNLVYALHQSIQNDSAPTLAVMQDGSPPLPQYDDWKALSELAPVLGEWTTFSRYFSDALAGEYVGITNADDYFSDDLEDRVTGHHAAPVTGFAKQTRHRRQLDAAWAFAAIGRILGTEETPAELESLLAAESDFEMTGLSAPGPELPFAQKLAARLQSRAAENQPGYLLLNPCPYTRRVALELDPFGGPVPVEGPIKAAQFDADRTRLVAEVPPLGFAWIPSKGKPGAAAPKQRIRMAEGAMVRNEYFEAEIDPSTGGLRSFRDVRTKVARIGMQLIYNPGSRAEGRGVRITQNGTALGEVVSDGVILNEQNEELATFQLRLRAWLNRPVLDCRVEITPKHLPTGYPWHAYYGARFAWRDERAAILRGINGLAMTTTHSRPVSPDFVEIKLGGQGVTILPGGLPFFQKHGSRMLDLVLLPEGEESRVFDFALALDRDYPMPAAQGMISPLAVVPSSKGPPHVGPSGWLFQLDSPNVLMLDFRPAADGSKSVVATLMETSGVHGGSMLLHGFRDPASAHTLDGDDTPISGLTIEGDAVRIDFAAGELLRIRVEF